MLVGVLAGCRLEGVEGSKVKLLHQLVEGTGIRRRGGAPFGVDGGSCVRAVLLQACVEVAGYYQGVPAGAHGDGPLQRIPDLLPQAHTLFGAILDLLVDVDHVVRAMAALRFDEQKPA